MKLNTRRAIFEFLSIVVAVILAMTLTEWRQDHLNRRLAQQSFTNIIEEIQDNLEELRADSVRIAKDREFMTEWVRQWVKDRKPPSFEASFSLSILSTAAWEVAKVNQSLTYLDNQDNMDIAEIYALQAFYTTKASEVFDLMGDLQGVSSKQETDEFFQIVQKLRYHLNLVFNTIRTYISGAEEFLAEQEASSESG